MDVEEAKILLSAARAGTRDAGDPQLAEALAMASRDSELKQWFEDMQGFDSIMRTALQSELPPPGLREAILARAGKTKAKSRRSFFPVLALAACLAAALGIALVFKPGAASRATGPDFVREFATLGNHGLIWLAKKSEQPSDLRAWLADQRAPSEFPLPASLASAKSKGCQTYTFHGAKVSLMCFRLDDQRIVHLFVIDEAALLDPPGSSPKMVHDGTTVAATWSAGGKVFVLTGVDEETLSRLI